MKMILFVAITALLLAAGLTRRFSTPGSRLYILDHPNERSLHSNPTPRSGGVAVLTGIGVAMLWVLWRYGMQSELIWLMASVTLLALVSYYDDRRPLPVVVRLIAQLVSSGMLLAGGLVLSGVSVPGVRWVWLPWIGYIGSILFIVWVINLYNFMDGMDGFAGGMAVIGCATFAVLGWSHGHTVFASVSLAVCAAALGFLLFNFPPARIFLGDVGSAPLGLIVAGLSLWAARDGVFPLWIAMLIFSPFVVDATVTLVRRLFVGERIWVAHRSHYYQRLVQLGWGHRNTVLWEYTLMLACGVSAIWAVRQVALLQWLVLAFWSVCYAIIAVSVHKIEKRTRH
jgi:UDP-N-acetylmuramyl pentapeptide phosphotransferase/UDP-N-acetylglucosamine-1-phosphate transferase